MSTTYTDTSEGIFQRSYLRRDSLGNEREVEVCRENGRDYGEHWFIGYIRHGAWHKSAGGGRIQYIATVSDECGDPEDAAANAIQRYNNQYIQTKETN